MSEASGPLAGTRVIELGAFIAGPFCGQLLADLGADVIKIEPPGSGDAMRQWGAVREDGKTLWWPVIARNKRSVTVDLRTEDGQNIVRELAADADVLIENFRPGTLEKWGLSPQLLLERNERLIVGRVSGFGQTGPYRGYRTTEIGLRAASGELYLAGQPHQPLKKGGNVSQYLGGINGFIGAMGALFQREASGEGRLVDVSSTEATAAIVGQALREQVAYDFIPGRRPLLYYRSAFGALHDPQVEATRDALGWDMPSLSGIGPLQGKPETEERGTTQ